MNDDQSHDPDEYGDPVPDFAAPEVAEAVLGGLAADDMTRAKQFVDWMEGKLKYIPENKVWSQWRDGSWRADGGERVMHDYGDFTKEAAKDLADITDLKKRVAFLKLWAAARSHRSVGAAISLARGDEAVYSSVVEWDRNQWLLGVKNGVVDLKTGEHRDAIPDDLMLKKSPYDFNKDATCPRFLKFLGEILPHEGLPAFMIRALGYSLTGVTDEQKLFFMYGDGNNGKSTLIKVLSNVLGAYSWSAGSELAVQGRTETPTDRILGPLVGQRLVIGAEIADGARLAEARLKDLSGGDRLQGRLLYGQSFQFEPTHKIWLYGNSKPRVSGTDNGIWRRMCLIPFTHAIPADKINGNLVEELMEEASGILNLLIAGCRDWQENGLQIPQIVTDAVKDYRMDEDIMGQFLEEECVFEEKASCPRRLMVQACKAWGELNMGLKNFGGGRAPSDRIRKALHARYPGFDQTAKDHNDRIWRGIRLRDPAQFPND